MAIHRLPRPSYHPKDWTKQRSYYHSVVSMRRTAQEPGRHTLGCENFAIASSSRIYAASLAQFWRTAIFFTARATPFCLPLVHVSSHTLPNPPPPTCLSCFQVSSLRTVRWRDARLDSKYLWTVHPSQNSTSSCESRTRSGSRAMGVCTCGLSKPTLVFEPCKAKRDDWEDIRTGCEPICVESKVPKCAPQKSLG